MSLDDPDEEDFILPQAADVIKIDDKDVPKEQTSYSLEKEERDYFKNALVIGREEKTDYVFGHKIKVQTTSVAEELQASLLSDKYQQSSGYARAFRTAMVAAYIREIDDKPLYTPISSEDADHIVQRKFDILQTYFPLFVDQVYEQMVKGVESDLAAKVKEKLGK